MSTIASISIAARATLNMHSLNNEGGEGNQVQTRMCTVVDDVGRKHVVNGISGDMMRHMVAEHLLRIAVERSLPLSTGAKNFDANRINADDAAMKAIGAAPSNREKLDNILKTCAVTDIMGTLITANNASLPRKSVLEFGWALALPELGRTDSFFHARYSNERGTKSSASPANISTEGNNENDLNSETSSAEAPEGGALRDSENAIFHRPASSGVYAIVCHLELARIGFNDISQQYPLLGKASERETLAERKKRAQALLDAVLYAFLELNGAMRSMQLPHLTALSGIVTTSSGVVPAPLVSPLAGGKDRPEYYRDQVQGIVKVLNGNNGSTVEAKPFEDLTGFTRVLIEIRNRLELADLTRGLKSQAQ